MQHEITVKVGFDAAGFEQAVRAYLVDLVASGTAKYDQETYDQMVEKAEELVGDFVTTETVSISIE